MTASQPQDDVDDLMPGEDDLLYEEELLRNPYSMKLWWRYIGARKHAPAKRRYLLYERAVKALPGSYKLWHAYLQERKLAVRGLSITNPAMEALSNTFERALVTMHKMPRIWLEYLTLLMEQKLVTHTRRAFDRALAAIPITQHDRIWQLYLEFIRQPGIPVETALRVYRRYLKLEPSHTEEFIAYLKSQESWGEAAQKLAEVVNDDMFRSLEGKSKHQLWLELCDIVTKHPEDVASIKVEAIIRGGIRKFTDEVGRLWTSLADYFIRQGESMFEKARDIYEEGLASVVTVRDFSLIFDALAQFEESLINAKMAHLDIEEEDDQEDIGTDFLLKDDGNDLDLRIARLERLMSRRPELLSSVMLRQNPHNVHEWHKRVKLFEGQPTKQILTYTEAVKTVDDQKAVGKPHTLWCSFAKYYEKHGDVHNARVIFEKAVQVQYKYVDDLASVWCEWAEMELRHQNFKRAMEVMRRATAAPQSSRERLTRDQRKNLPVQERLYRSLKLWSFFVDLEESLGTMESTRAVYDRVLELRIATPQIILNYAMFLQEQKYWEDSFQVYERGVVLFKYPHVRDIWQAYLTQFVDRYGGQKLERARDLFEQALQQAPPADSKPIFMQFAALEEKYGLAKHAMTIYERAVKTVPQKERLDVYKLYISRASDFFGIGKVREIYEMAIEAHPPHDLADDDCRAMCLQYAGLERNLGEIDRARAIYVHASSLCDPNVDKAFWEEWKQFEVKHGNEDTFMEMRRIKRSVAASYSQMHYNMATVEATIPSTGTVEAGSQQVASKLKQEDEMAALERGAEQAGGTGLFGRFVRGEVIQQGEKDAAADGEAGPSAPNPEEIDIDVDDDDEEGEGGSKDMELAQKEVPAAVFGSIKRPAAQEAVGAMERLKRKKAAEKG
ncbi:unnamed protein product [Ostreobium quekettii]|uniref:Pre-mRNA-splicing factor SYF1 n=1 Tax=Ostreobium quekettii TaxID=121088 RepID=A0A8S1IQ08_9CHLO|nr:unnamed protein product [Ostreobium quekettii]|eukprot:evm.model.scf_822.4 EVM.evm.TU.scf_822.4   scf_822:17507-27387(+)